SPPFGRIDPQLGAPRHLTGLYVVDSVLTGDGERLRSAVSAIWLPALVLGFAVMAPIMRIVRQGMIEALEAPPTVALRALGARPSSIVLRHALKNAMLPVTTMVAVVYGYLLGGSVLVETIFSWPGMGLYVYNSISSSDFPAVQGFILYATTMYVVVFLLLDLLYLALDPRVKY
ncbi:MAG: peptide ABC transporter permease, partial [Thermoleophilia bacterium]